MATGSQRFEERQSMKNTRFEIFHYREAGQRSVGVHHHDFYELYFFLGGDVSFLVEGRHYALQSGDLLLINPSQLHQPLVTPGGVYERIVLWIDRGYLAELSTAGLDLASCFQPGRPNLLHPSKLLRTVLQELLEGMTREFYSGDPGGEQYALGLFLQLMVEVNRLALQTQSKPSAETGDLTDRVIAYIGGHYREEITLESLAGEFFVSKYHLSHEFSRRMGISIYRYVILKRLLQARERILAGEAPGEVYKSCGFGDYANFYRAFKAEYGISPRQMAEQEN